MRHGQPLKAKALRPAFRAYVEAGGNQVAGGELQSYRDIAFALPGVSYSTVRRWMEADFPDTFAMMAGGMDEAEGGSRPSHRDLPDAPYDLTMKALDLLDDAQALMGGVESPELRHRVWAKADHLKSILELTGAGTLSEDRGF